MFIVNAWEPRERNKMRGWQRLVAVAGVLSLAACSSWMGKEEDPPLPGERISVMQLQRKLEPDDTKTVASDFVAPSPWANEFWPQAGGYSNHALQHLDLSGEPLKRVWKADIGEGSTSRNPLTAQPVLADGRIFAMDVEHEVSALDAASGKRLWWIDAGASDEDDTVVGGGLGFSAGVLYVTNGYGEVLALRPDDGGLIWRARLPAPAQAAPTVLDGRIFVGTVDNRLVALGVEDGRVLWTYRGVAEGAGLLGRASAAANREVVIAPFSSGEIYALRVENGAVAWSDNLAPAVRMGGIGGLSDIRALPVLDGGLTIAMSYAGRLAAIDTRSGARAWQRDIGGQETPWVAGPHLFVLSTDNQLLALDKESGKIRWVTQLEKFTDPKNRDGSIIWTGPIYAGGRLIVAGSDGRALDIAPDTGAILREWSVGDTPATPMVVAGRVLYVLTRDGYLSAWK